MTEISPSQRSVDDMLAEARELLAMANELSAQLLAVNQQLALTMAQAGSMKQLSNIESQPLTQAEVDALVELANRARTVTPRPL